MLTILYRMERCPVDHAPQFPFRRDPNRPLDPAPELMMLLRERPMSRVTLWNGKQVWLATRFEDVCQVLSSPQLSVSPAHENAPSVSAAVEARKKLDSSFQRKDPPAHTRERRIWQPFFSNANVEALRPAIQRYVDEAIDDLLANGSPADLVERVATVIPSRLIMEVLAIPEGDRAFVQQQSAILANSGVSMDVIAETSSRLLAWWRRFVKDRLENPGSDFLSQLIVREVGGGSLTEDEVVADAVLIQFAGQHTTANSISLGTLTLLQHPDVIAKFRADARRTPRVVEELLRYLTIVHNGSARVVLQDVVIGGETLHAGEGVIAHLSTANRDEAVFSNADQFDPERKARFHTAFGAGPHACIGAPLARAELQIVFDTLFRRIPTLRLAVEPEKAGYKSDGLFYGLHSLPVAW